MDQILGHSSEDVLKIPRHGGRGLTTIQRSTLDLSKKIKGWGSDIDPNVRPGVPMDKAPDIGIEFLYPNFEPQIAKHKVHKSTEHGQMPPVFGNVCPPKGLSGLIRDFAYRFSEGQSRHWILLVLADRVDMIEVLLSDIFRLQIPNIPKEMGINAMLKYNRKEVYKWAAIAAVGAVAIGAYVKIRKRESL